MSGNHRTDEFSAEFGHVESILRGLGEQHETLEEPPADLWHSISAEIGVSATRSAPVGGRGDAAGGEVLPFARRRSRTVAYLGAAAAAVVLAVAGFVVVTRDEGADAPVLAEADLTFDAQNYDPLGAVASTTAELVEQSDGTFEIRLVDTDLPAPVEGQEDLELWLLNDPEAPTDLVSLGVVDPDEPGVFEVPAGYDPDTFFVVDISVEPRDGEPTHSGRTILRGPLHVI